VYAKTDRGEEGGEADAEEDNQDNADAIADIERQIEEHML
jgi:hypothetical protein